MYGLEAETTHLRKQIRKKIEMGGGYTNEPFDPIINVSVQYFFVFYTGGKVQAGSMSNKYVKSLLDFCLEEKVWSCGNENAGK